MTSHSGKSRAIKTPVTLQEGTSKEFFDNYGTIIDALIEASVP